MNTGKNPLFARNDATGKYDFVRLNGSPQMDPTESHAVLAQAFGKRGAGDQPGWVGDTDGRHGSLLWQVKQDRASTPSQAKAAMEDALQTLVDEKRLVRFRVDARRVAPGNFRVDVDFTDTAGNTGKVRRSL